MVGRDAARFEHRPPSQSGAERIVYRGELAGALGGAGDTP